MAFGKDPAQLCGSGPAGSPAPQINGQLTSQCDDELLFERGAVFKLLEKLLACVPEGLSSEQAPYSLDQERAHTGVAVSIDGTEALDAATGMFTGTTTGVTADGFVFLEPVPITDFALDQ